MIYLLLLLFSAPIILCQPKLYGLKTEKLLVSGRQIEFTETNYFRINQTGYILRDSTSSFFQMEPSIGLAVHNINNGYNLSANLLFLPTVVILSMADMGKTNSLVIFIQYFYLLTNFKIHVPLTNQFSIYAGHNTDFFIFSDRPNNVYEPKVGLNLRFEDFGIHGEIKKRFDRRYFVNEKYAIGFGITFFGD